MHAFKTAQHNYIAFVCIIVATASGAWTALAQTEGEPEEEIRTVRKTKSDVACPSNKRFVIEYWRGSRKIKSEDDECVPNN